MNGKQSTLFFEVSGVLLIALENPNDCFILSPGRAHIRIRSPRFVASSLWNKVGKGSRQTRSVTLGKGLALRVGYRGPCSKAVAKQTLLDAPK